MNDEIEDMQFVNHINTTLLPAFFHQTPCNCLQSF